MERGEPFPMLGCDVICPNPETPTVLLGRWKCGWLKVYISTRSSVRNRYVIDVLLEKFTSQTSHPGSSRMFRPALPKRGCPAASAASMNCVVKQLVSNHWSTVG